MEQADVPFQRILFVCVNRRDDGTPCCAARDSDAIAAALKTRVKSLGLAGQVRVSRSGCQDLCARGPNVMLFPAARWYRGVTLEDVERIIRDAIDGLPDRSGRATA